MAQPLIAAMPLSPLAPAFRDPSNLCYFSTREISARPQSRCIRESDGPPVAAVRSTRLATPATSSVVNGGIASLRLRASLLKRRNCVAAMSIDSMPGVEMREYASATDRAESRNDRNRNRGKKAWPAAVLKIAGNIRPAQLGIRQEARTITEPKSVASSPGVIGERALRIRIGGATIRRFGRDGGRRFGRNSHFFDAQRTLKIAEFLAKIALASGGIGKFVLDDLLQSMAQAMNCDSKRVAA